VTNSPHVGAHGFYVGDRVCLVSTRVYSRPRRAWRWFLRVILRRKLDVYTIVSATATTLTIDRPVQG
jgi:hypothetical protein